MDTELARTFLAVLRSGSFIGAGETLHVTQTTVTARIRNLESQLGCRLFIRNHSGASLTPHGERFVSHASQLVRSWEAARRELPLPEGTGRMLSLGGEISLWRPLLLNWLALLRQQMPDTAVRVEVGEAASLHDKLKHGALDAILVHLPHYWPGIQVTQIRDEKLIMIRSKHAETPYIYVDWGEHFRQQHDAALPEFAESSIYCDLGPLALNYLLEQGGQGYFRKRVVQEMLDDGQLIAVEGWPEFSYPIYLVHSQAPQAPQLSQPPQTPHSIQDAQGSQEPKEPNKHTEKTLQQALELLTAMLEEDRL